MNGLKRAFSGRDRINAPTGAGQAAKAESDPNALLDPWRAAALLFLLMGLFRAGMLTEQSLHNVNKMPEKMFDKSIDKKALWWYIMFDVSTQH